MVKAEELRNTTRLNFMACLPTARPAWAMRDRENGRERVREERVINL